MYASLVEQQTTTTGTGSYVVSGSVTGRRTFAQGYTANLSYIPYVVTDDAGNFECGIGTWTFATNTLARTTVLESSNADAAVDWAAGTKRIYVSPHGNVAMPIGVRHMMKGAEAAPTSADSTASGYGPFSQWMDYLRNKLFICFNPGKWSLALVRDSFGGTYIDGADSGPGSGSYGYGQIQVFTANTTDATPHKMAFADDYAMKAGIYCEGISGLTITGTVTALDISSGDMAAWEVKAVAQGAADGTVTIQLGAAPTLLHASAGAATWSIAVIGSAAGTYDATIEVTGEAATNITWAADLRVCQVQHF